ncbi:hypothetical protein ABTM94_19130, partial [Acinetobacter baumannii]
SEMKTFFVPRLRTSALVKAVFDRSYDVPHLLFSHKAGDILHTSWNEARQKKAGRHVHLPACYRSTLLVLPQLLRRNVGLLHNHRPALDFAI